ncbi:AAA family ATPase [Streptomyces sp. NPDC057638]|uniref:AAA family ATPase n=1 Tax=Streptomyces sp. NPDC057638 TaxID=3346190 RepID=UPI0036C9A603
MAPLAVLFIGITGSGKTTLAQALTAHGYTRLSVDEEVHRLHGRYGIDYPEHTYFERERPALAAVLERFTKELEAGHDIVLDHGLWRRADRDTWTRAARAAGAHPVLVYLPTSRTELLERLEARNRRDDANALTVTPEALDDFFARFDPPADDEDAIVWTGQPDALATALRGIRRGESPRQPPS